MSRKFRAESFKVHNILMFFWGDGGGERTSKFNAFKVICRVSRFDVYVEVMFRRIFLKKEKSLD